MAGTRVDRLVDYLTGADAAPPSVATDALAADLRRWITGSRRFRAFAETHRDKARKKIRSARDAESRLDVRAELAVAHALFGDRRLDLAYERAGTAVGGPDFTVSFRSHLAFNLEVTRWRGESATLERHFHAKLRQLPPSVPNALLVVVDANAALPSIDAAVNGLRARADDRETRQRLGRLGGIYAWAEGGRAALWTNGSARIPLPPPAARAVLAALEAAVPGVRTDSSGS